MQTTTEAQRKMNGAVSTAVNEGRNVVDSTLNTIEKASNDLGRQAGQMVSRLGETTQDYYKSSEEYVKANPAKGIAIAAGAGLLIGSLLTAVFSRKH